MSRSGLGSVLVILAAGVLLTGCDDSPAAPDFTVKIATLSFPADSGSPLAVPGQVSGETTFEATVFTVGDGCTFRARTDVERSGGVVTLTPFNRRPHGQACIQIARGVPHTVRLSSGPAGLLVIRARGRSNRAPPGEDFLVVEDTVRVGE